MKSVNDFLKDFNKSEETGKEVTEPKKHLYKSLVKTDMEYEWHPVYEIEFSSGQKILWCKINNKLVQVRKIKKEIDYSSAVQDSLWEWMKESSTKSRNKRWAEYYKAKIKGMGVAN